MKQSILPVNVIWIEIVGVTDVWIHELVRRSVVETHRALGCAEWMVLNVVCVQQKHTD